MFYKLTFPEVTHDGRWYRFWIEMNADPATGIDSPAIGGLSFQHDGPGCGGALWIAAPGESPHYGGLAFEYHYPAYVHLMRWHGYHPTGPHGHRAYLANTSYYYRCFQAGGQLGFGAAAKDYSADECLAGAKRCAMWGNAPEDGDFLAALEQHGGNLTQLLLSRLPGLHAAFLADWEAIVAVHRCNGAEFDGYEVIELR